MRRRAVVLAASTLLAAFPASSGTILERVLASLSAMEPDGFRAVLANVAENAGSVMDRPRTLAKGDQVVIGFDVTGAPVTAEAGPLGLHIDSETASGLQSGLAAGIYPVGSALYRLPPAGQLSLFEADQAGHRLDLAHELLAARIDGSVRFQAFAEVSQDPALVAVRALSASLAAPDGGAPGFVSTTVLGAVNSGSVLKGMELGSSLPPLVASVTAGADGQIMMATSGDALAVMSSSARFGSMNGGIGLAMNEAANGAAVDGSIAVAMAGLQGRIGALTTTVLGAVNTGIVRSETD